MLRLFLAFVLLFAFAITGLNYGPVIESAVAPVLTERAADLVGGDREVQHGTKRKNFENIVTLWNAYLQIRRDPAAPLTIVDHAHMMVLLKIARTQHGAFNPEDSVDMVGYSACAGEVACDLNEQP